MGNRGHIVVHGHGDTPVVLYTHWHASNLPTLLAEALATEARWSDPEYLTRIIFDQVSQAAGSETTGAGIGTSTHGDCWRIIDVYPADRDVDDDYGRIVFREGCGYGTDEHGGKTFSFDEFVEQFHTTEPEATQ